MDIVWFMALCATLLIWLDWDRQARLDSTRALPVIPVCREVIEMATRRLAMGRGLDQGVAEVWHRTLNHALDDAEHDTPANRQMRADLERDGWALSPPDSVDSWDEALTYRTRDEALAEESLSPPPSTPL